MVGWVFTWCAVWSNQQYSTVIFSNLTFSICVVFIICLSFTGPYDQIYARPRSLQSQFRHAFLSQLATFFCSFFLSLSRSPRRYLVNALFLVDFFSSLHTHRLSIGIWSYFLCNFRYIPPLIFVYPNDLIRPFFHPCCQFQSMRKNEKNRIMFVHLTTRVSAANHPRFGPISAS